MYIKVARNKLRCSTNIATKQTIIIHDQGGFREAYNKFPPLFLRKKAKLCAFSNTETHGAVPQGAFLEQVFKLPMAAGNAAEWPGGGIHLKPAYFAIQAQSENHA